MFCHTRSNDVIPEQPTGRVWKVRVTLDTFSLRLAQGSVHITLNCVFILSLFDYTHCIIQIFNIDYHGKINVCEIYINCEFAKRVL
jgi:hypothetical protein